MKKKHGSVYQKKRAVRVFVEISWVFVEISQSPMLYALLLLKSKRSIITHAQNRRL